MTDIFKTLNDINTLWGFLTICVIMIPLMFLAQWMFRMMKNMKKENLNGNGSKSELAHLRKDVCEMRKDMRTLFSKVNALSEDLALIKGLLKGKGL